MPSPASPLRPSMPLLTALAIACVAAGVLMLATSGSRPGGIALVVAGVGLAALPAVQRRRGRRISALAGAGRPARARIVSVHELRPRGGVRRVRVHYEISPDDRPAYRLTTRHLVPPGLETTFRQGNVISVRIDPADPTNVVFVAGD